MVDFPWDKISIAPMMDITDRRFRFFMRLINARVKLYTEMIVAQAIVLGGVSGRTPIGVRAHRERLLKFDESEHPVVLQLGGDDAHMIAEAGTIGEDFGYDMLDVNCGCPSERVENGNFGVCLMRTPERVADIVAALRARVKIPVSVKCRLGITGEESEEKLIQFIETVTQAGAASVTVHARTASLGGFSPKQNREIPPLDYEIVYRLKNKFPQLPIEINGGIRTHAAIVHHLARVDRVMIGRPAHEDPLFFSERSEVPSFGYRVAIMERMAEYAARYEKPDLSAARFFATMLNVWHGVPGARAVRRFLSEEGRTLSPATAVAALKNSLATHAESASC